jgi:Fe-S oxidoreductase
LGGNADDLFVVVHDCGATTVVRQVVAHELLRQSSYSTTDEGTAMRVGLMVPCYIDMFYPQVGKSTLELLERFGVEVDYPFDQTCCGQPMANSGAHTEAKATEELFVRNFAKYDYIVASSGSCVHHIRHKFTRPTTPLSVATSVRMCGICPNSFAT